MKIVIIKYNAGNTASLNYALQRIGYESIISDDEKIIQSADKILFPGQGEASSAMQFLQEKKIDILIKQLQQPVLGICVGLQLLCMFSEEGETNCIDIIPATVKKIPPPAKVPHIGWNTITKLQTPLFANVLEGAYVYYANSFCVPPIKQSIALTNYHQNFSAALHHKNFYGIQFHPEKSGLVGEQILRNFLTLC